MLEYIGYLASLIVLISLLMSSAKKLRIVNLLGSAIFAVYGILIAAYPVGVMNGCIVIINVIYLYKMYKTNDYFKILPIDKNSEYLRNFMSFYKDDIAKFFSLENVDVDNSDISFYILRNVVPAGFFVGNKHSEDTLKIDFDYVVPTYRDFKMGEYIFKYQKQLFLDKGYKNLIAYTDNEKHMKYLHKMGFDHVEDMDKDNEFCYKIVLQA